MSNLNKLLNFEYGNAYDFAYDLSMKKNYSNPKIYDANGDLTKRWYVYFSYRNPETGKLKRVTPFYGKTNSYKTKAERMFVLMIYKHKILELLKRGYNPFEDNTDFFIKENQEVKHVKKVEPKVVEPKVVTAPKTVAVDRKTVKEGLEFALKLKERLVNATTMRDYTGKSKALQQFIKKEYPELKYIDQITKKILTHFLNTILERSSARTRNNYRIDLSSLFQVLEENEIIATNSIKNIKVLKALPERHKTYSKQLDADIFKYLEEKDPILLLYIKFISYNFLRPIEVNRIKVGDINLNERTISFKAKNKALKTKIIPDVLLKEIPDLTKLNTEDYLFTPEKIGGVWEATEVNRRDYFSRRFRKVVKKHFDLDKNYGLYSFRHTYITKLYRELVKNGSPFEAKSRLMQITGHSTMTALEKYLRDIDAELPEDYSEYFKED
ncbi:site-specific integrase [Lutibacter sp. TH_r2]|uniref:tyrosine-type recombinase/integrase n=1 Tax=Lutibacter sp. TH_r2 TaxID=3082083 RepID=UPI0029536B14|nr:site-specific integrase [Lutibacter sp. TH_r2]MDV7186111.1 site-specific integrase [Lutibacter sp. TH_r2]